MKTRSICYGFFLWRA